MGTGDLPLPPIGALCGACGFRYFEHNGHVVACPRCEVQRLRKLINTPRTDDWIEAVKLEAAHQVERWGVEDRAGKGAADWFWLLGYLSGKALASFIKGDAEKGLHHIVSSAAVLLNWHRNVTGEITSFRPASGEAVALVDGEGE